MNTQAQSVVTAELLKYQKRIKNRLKLMEKQKPKPKITQSRVGTALPVGAGFRKVGNEFERIGTIKPPIRPNIEQVLSLEPRIVVIKTETEEINDKRDT